MSIQLSRAGWIGCASLLALSSAAWGQDGTGAVAANEPGLNDIVVTAQRRAQSLQDVPISLSVLTDEALSRGPVQRLEDLQFAVPTLTFLGNNVPQGQLSLIRGVGTFSYSDALEPSVGTVIDGVPLARTAMAFVNFFDIERVEALKGPQGTLFGKNSSAGLINIVTKRPEFDFGAAGQLSYGNRNELLANASVTGPVADGVALRLTAHLNRRDGFVRQPARDERLNDLDRYGVRGKLLIAPDGGAGELLISGELFEIDERCCAFTVREFGAQAGLIGPGGLLPLVTNPGPGNRVSAAESPIRNRSRILGLTADGKIEIGDLTLSSITGWRGWRNRNSNESDGTPLPILGAPGDLGRTRYDQFSQELRVSTPDKADIYLTGGLFFSVVDTRSSGVASGNLGAALPPGFLFSQQTSARSEAQNYAVFGELAWRATERLLLTAGGRLIHDRLSASYDRQSSFPLPGTSLGDTSSGEGRRSDTGFVARGVAQYDWSNDVMTYVSVARGYKGPGADTNPVPGFAGALYSGSFALSETSMSYEAGLKSELLDRKITFNVSAFWTDFRNLQTTLFDASVAQFRLLNARRYRTRGVEFDASLRPVTGLTLAFAGAYVDAQPRSFPSVPCTVSPSPVPCVNGLRDVSGARAPLVPKWSFNVAADYQTALTRGADIFARVDYNWRSSILYDFDQDPGNIQGSFGLLNGKIGLVGEEGRWRVAAYGRNLTNRKWTNLIFDTPVFGGYAQYPEIGRQYGLELGFGF